MIYRIIGALMFSFLVIALVLSFAGVSEVHLGNGFIYWLRDVNFRFEEWSFKIPQIPDIPLLDESGKFIVKAVHRPVTTPVIAPGNTIGGRILSIINVLITFFNFLIGVINFFITIVNIFIQVLQFVLTMVYAVKDLPGYLVNDEWALYGGATSIWWWPSVGV